MPTTLRARLSEELSRPELSRMWESERTTFTTGSGDGIDTFLTAPEMVLDPQGNEVTLSYPADADADHMRVRQAFERAVHRFRPNVQIDWAA